MTAKTLLAAFDYAILKPEATMDTLLRAAERCRALGVGSLCVKSCDVAFAAECLRGSATRVIAVVGFPHGNTVGALKAMEAQLAVAQGAEEIDMVINVSALRDGDLEGVTDDIRAVVTAAWPHPVKAILETALLSPAEIRRGVACAVKAGAAFVKTSTGFGPGGATPEAVRTMLAAAKGRVRVKASGGIRTRADAEAYLAMGCARLGVGDVLSLLTDAERRRFGLAAPVPGE